MARSPSLSSAPAHTLARRVIMAVNNIRKGNMDMLAKQMEDALGRNIDFNERNEHTVSVHPLTVCSLRSLFKGK